nr:immunoglobulin heavy chain junction region [Macaca mulatta]
CAIPPGFCSDGVCYGKRFDVW